MAATIRTIAGDRPENTIFPTEREYVHLELLRWGTWVKDGRRVDPWASGAGKGIDYSKPRVMSSRMSYGPGTAADGDEGQAHLAFIESCVTRLRDTHRLLVHWRYVEARTGEDIATRLRRSPRWVGNQWPLIYVRMLVMLKRWEVS